MRLKDIERRLGKIGDSELWSDIRIRLRNKNSSRLKYSKLLFISILEGTNQIISSLRNENINMIKRYYLKPLIEDYINLKNIRYYGKDYIKAMNINNLREVLQTQDKSSYGAVYKMLGESVYSFDADDIKKRQRQKWSEIEDKEIKRKMSIGTNEIKFSLFFDERMDLYEEFEEDSKVLKKNFLAGLYDYVNNYSHLNLYYLRKIEMDDDRFTQVLMDFIDKVTVEATKDIGKIFSIKDIYLKELYSSEDYDEYIFDNYDLSMHDDDDEIQTEDMED